MKLSAAEILAMTKEVAIAYLARNDATPDVATSLIRSVNATLRELAAQDLESPPIVNETRTVRKPAVPIDESVCPDLVKCLECGRSLKTLKLHLFHEHGLGEGDYKERWGLTANHPLVAPSLTRRRSELSIKSDFGISRRLKCQALED